MNAYEFKPLLDGTTLAKALETKPGPWMKEALDVVMAWQLRNPEATDTAAILNELQAWKNNFDDKTKKHDQTPPPNRTITKKQKQGELTSALISHFLHLTLRPIFSQTQHPDLTDTGRRNINASIARKNQDIDFNGKLPPWKGQQSWALGLLKWICQSLDSAIVEKEWGFLIPPILTLLDSVDVETKAIGCDLLRLLLNQTPTSLLARTGLAPVFEESLYTCTTYLPSITSTEDSALILSEALPALVSLANAAYPETSPGRTTSLLNVLRKGFLAPMDHAAEHVVIAEALYTQLPTILEALGIDCVIHLKDLVPMISATLDEPLAPAYPPLLLVALNAMRTLAIEAKPRVWFWRNDFLKGLCGLWMRLHPIADDELAEESAPALEKVKDLCIVVVEAIDDAVTDEQWAEKGVRDAWPKDVSDLIKADERLKSLFDEIQANRSS
jgi:tRNA nucleotidyltransferase (CCA-adding enzyme)